MRWRFTIYTDRGAWFLAASRFLYETIVMIAWTVAFFRMIMTKGKDFRLAFQTPPYGTWYTAVAMACLQMFVSPSPRERLGILANPARILLDSCF